MYARRVKVLILSGEAADNSCLVYLPSRLVVLCRVIYFYKRFIYKMQDHVLNGWLLAQKGS